MRKSRKTGSSKKKSLSEKEKRRGRGFDPDLAPMIVRVLEVLGRLTPDLRKWLALNIAILTVAMLQLWRGARGGHGGITLCALSRTIPLSENEKARSKRLYRLLRNPLLEGTQMTPLLIRLSLGVDPKGWIPIVVDQTDIRGTPTIMAGIRVANRILPVAFCCFEFEKIRKSQNLIELSLLLLIAASLPLGCKPLFVMDRGYARVSLLKDLKKAGIPYLIRGRSNTIVRYQNHRRALGRLSHRQGKAIRYRTATYQDQEQEPVDIVLFHDPDFKEPWYLLVPPDSKDKLPTEEVVSLYRERMHIELTFRDWKTHLGIRSLQLEVDIAPRLERLLLILTVAYIVAVLLGACAASKMVREHCEVLRSTPRHGTRRRLSALSVAILLLSLPRFYDLARQALEKLLEAMSRGLSATRLATNPP